MKKALVVLGILVLIGLVILTQQYEPEPVTLFSVSQGPDSSLQPLSVVDCSLDAGYDWCYSSTNGPAYAEIQFTYWLGTGGYGEIDGANRHYYIDEIYINVKTDGDITYTTSTWDAAGACGSSGCSGTSIPDGKYVIGTAPSKIEPYVYLTVWDKFTSTTGAYWWSSVSGGLDPSSTVYVIDCYDNGDCESGNYCDKSGSWETWTCEVDPCTTMPAPENICEGFDLWSQKCVYGDIVKDQLIETNSVECGCVLPPETIDNVCIGYDLWSQKQAEPCINEYVQDELIEEKSPECGYVCAEGEKIFITCTDGTEIVKQQCLNNVWIDIEISQCPLNWINLEMILESYIEEIKAYLEELL